jgi:hypothetical protein
VLGLVKRVTALSGDAASGAHRDEIRLDPLDRYPNTHGIRALNSCRARTEHPFYFRDWAAAGTKKSGVTKIGQDCEDPAVIVDSFVEPELQQDLADVRLDGLGTQDQQFRDRVV